jgi:hypothetical protein
MEIKSKLRKRSRVKNEVGWSILISEVPPGEK